MTGFDRARAAFEAAPDDADEVFEAFCEERGLDVGDPEAREAFEASLEAAYEDWLESRHG